MKDAIMGVALFAMALGLFGQSAPAPLTFEVASIKPSNPNAEGSGIQFMPGGGLRMTNVTLKQMITFGYDVRPFQVQGGPGWINSDRYDLLAKPDSSPGAVDATTNLHKMTDEQFMTTQQQMRARLQPLLAERFQLAVHRETKEQSVYALVIGKSGSKLKETKGEGRRMGITRGKIDAQGVPLQIFVQNLSSLLGRPVLDQTGLKGDYDFELSWTPDPGQSPGPAGPPGLDASTPPDPNGPSLFTAIQEQLGLRLESAKGPVEMIVIDRAEKASEN
jgi:bla regulator protein blaR1